MAQLAQLIRDKYPNDYKDMSDEDLEKSVLAKHPEYQDLVKSKEKSADTILQENKLPQEKEQPKYEPQNYLVNTRKSMIENQPQHEPDTFWGGFFKSLKDQALGAAVPAIQGAAHPEGIADIAGLLIPSELPNLRGLLPKGKLSRIAESIKPNEIPRNEIPYGPEAPIMDEGGRAIAPALPPERPQGPWNANTAANIVNRPSAEDLQYNLARDKFNMGRELPEEMPSEIPIQQNNKIGQIFNSPEEIGASEGVLQEPMLGPGGSKAPQFNPLGKSGMTSSGETMPENVDTSTGEVLPPEKPPIIPEGTGNEEPPESLSSKVKYTPESQFLNKLADFSSKTARSVLGFHLPGTAISFHGFNEVIRNTLFGPDFNPINAIGRGINAVDYLARPSKANDYLVTNAADLAKAIKDGGLRVQTGDVIKSSLFQGKNIPSKGFNYLTDPKPLFEQVIPALKLKSYQGVLNQLVKDGMEYKDAAKAAGYATNNIYGGLNLQALEKNPTTQKLFRVAALAPDWLETNYRLGKGFANAIRNPSLPQNRVYQVGMANFLGSYFASNVLNAVNNNGKFMWQNEPGHEFDIAFGKDEKGRVRYFSPYGTAMDMIRIPLAIAHAAINGNIGKSFSEVRSRTSEPLQFLTDLMTNTDYKSSPLYNKTKYGKQMSYGTQGENIAKDAASHFLPIGANAGIDFAQGKISPEQFASQVLQVPMKYKFPDKSYR